MQGVCGTAGPLLSKSSMGLQGSPEVGRCHGIDLGWAGQTFFFFPAGQTLGSSYFTLLHWQGAIERQHIYMWQPAVSQRTKTGQAKWPFAQVSRTRAGALEVELQGNRCEGWGRR